MLELIAELEKKGITLPDRYFVDVQLKNSVTCLFSSCNL